MTIPRRKPIVAPAEPVIEPVKRVKKPLVAPDSLVAYTPSQIAEMDDCQLAAAFTRITGCTHLSCAHCKGERPITPYWMSSIRNKCMKPHGLSAAISLPKTCDAQLKTNTKWNSLHNAIYGPTYRILKSPDLSDEDKKMILHQRDEQLKAAGITPRAYKYN